MPSAPQDFEAVPMGFETGHAKKIAYKQIILKQSLWDLKLAYPQNLKPISCNFEAVPMGFETSMIRYFAVKNT